MSFKIASTLTIDPADAMALSDTVALGVAISLGVVCEVTSLRRKARYPGDKSYHRIGLARDYTFKTWKGVRLEGDDRIEAYRTLRHRLPANYYDVLDEGNHFHVEFDPK